MTMSEPPLVLDIDGTLTRADKSLDPRVIEPLRDWPAPVVLATGQVLPYAAALTRYLGVQRRAIGENGGLALVEDELLVLGDAEAAERLFDAWERQGGRTDRPVNNRWRETELAVVPDETTNREALRNLATDHDLEFLDSEFSYHVTSPAVSKGAALDAVCSRIGRDPEEFVAVGDAHNDIPMFEIVGDAFAVDNADPQVQRAADRVTEGRYADGTLEVLERIR